MINITEINCCDVFFFFFSNFLDDNKKLSPCRAIPSYPKVRLLLHFMFVTRSQCSNHKSTNREEICQDKI